MKLYSIEKMFIVGWFGFTQCKDITFNFYSLKLHTQFHFWKWVAYESVLPHSVLLVPFAIDGGELE